MAGRRRAGRLARPGVRRPRRRAGAAPDDLECWTFLPARPRRSPCGPAARPTRPPSTGSTPNWRPADRPRLVRRRPSPPTGSTSSCTCFVPRRSTTLRADTPATLGGALHRRRRLLAPAPGRRGRDDDTGSGRRRTASARLHGQRDGGRPLPGTVEPHRCGRAHRRGRPRRARPVPRRRAGALEPDAGGAGRRAQAGCARPASGAGGDRRASRPASPSCSGGAHPPQALRPPHRGVGPPAEVAQGQRGQDHVHHQHDDDDLFCRSVRLDSSVSLVAQRAPRAAPLSRWRAARRRTRRGRSRRGRRAPRRGRPA